MTWADDAFVYHVFPLGACGAEEWNDHVSAPTPRLGRIADRLDHIQALGCDTVLLGPVLESARHGYDTIDLFSVDRRLGTMSDLADLSADIHARGMRLMLDAVFNHVGRDFWAFRDVRERGTESQFWGWFHLDEDGRSPLGDPFWYEGWAGNYELVKLRVDHPDVRAHLLAALDTWVDSVGVDGLRLDAADVLSRDFLAVLSAHCAERFADFYLVGEMVSGDYRAIAGPGLLAGATNYEAYKSLWSAHRDRNYFEIAYALNRQFGPDGIYRNLHLLNFADNHDVDRVASSVGESRLLFPLFGLLLTMPGTPSVYYGSEVGDAATRGVDDDHALRPSFEEVARNVPELADAIRRLAEVRAALPALRHGGYAQLSVQHEQVAFAREHGMDRVIVAVNAAPGEAVVPIGETGAYVDHLEGGQLVTADSDGLSVPPGWLRVVTRA